MPMNQVIQEKRRALGLTQEQVAECLNVSVPAVSKWERGVTCPDVALLPRLARLLKTDVNTILCFREGLTREEIQGLCTELNRLVREEGLVAAFQQAEQSLAEYPGNEMLLQTLTMHLDGVLTLSGRPREELALFEGRLEAWYRRLGESGDEQIRNTALYMLTARLIQREEYGQAQVLLDRMPNRELDSVADKLYQQVAIDRGTGRGEKAAADLQRALLRAVNRVQVLMSALVGVELSLGENAEARATAEKSARLAQLMDLWAVHAGQAILPVALKEQNPEESMTALKQILCGALTPWKVENSVLYRRLKPEYRDVRLDFHVLEGMLSMLEKDPDCAFLRDREDFRAFIAECKEKTAG